MRLSILLAPAAAALLAATPPAPPPGARPTIVDAIGLPLAQRGMVLDAEAGKTIIIGCEQEATARHQSHAIVVVDTGGGEIAALRMNGNNRGIMDFARAKAEAVAAWGFPTSAMATSARDTPGFAQAPHVVTVAGGIPIFSADGKTFLGAAGASGEAPADDEACVTAGVERAGFRVRRG